LQLESVEETMKADLDVAQRHLDRARVLVRSSLAEARRSVWNLRAEALETDGLAPALATSFEAIAARDGIARHFHVTGANRRLPEPVEHCLLRVGQEAITNAVRHAEAANIWVDLHYELDAVRLTVRDDGIGFELAQAAQGKQDGFGLLGMHERVEQLAGELAIDSVPGRGSLVSARVKVAGLEHSGNGR
jgi:signal transduction histidine kinase